MLIDIVTNLVYIEKKNKKSTNKINLLELLKYKLCKTIIKSY